MPENRTYGPPDIELAGQQGCTVNPANFAGHDLVVLFCPANPDAAAQELTDYNALADALAYNDAYMVAICGREAGAPASRIALSTDRDRAWEAFRGCCSRRDLPSPDEGAVFLFGRGGCLRHIWSGVGHADDVMRWLGERM
jgi:peroxiredoxin